MDDTMPNQGGRADGRLLRDSQSIPQVVGSELLRIAGFRGDVLCGDGVFVDPVRGR